MEKLGNFDFKVGQLAETRSFELGYRGAWFRCKIKDIQLKKNKILVEYYDYEEKEKSWEKIYQVPSYGRKSRHITKQLRVRPEYPAMYHKSEVPAVTEDECMVVHDGNWKVNDMVEWSKDGCYWSARIVEVLGDDKYQVELPTPPAGEGIPGEKHEVYGTDLRPFLEWSETHGWTLLTEEGGPSCGAQLIFPTKQGTDMEAEHVEAVGSPVNGNKMHTYELGMDMEVKHAEAAASPVNASSITLVSGGGDSQKNEKGETDGDLVESEYFQFECGKEKRSTSSRGGGWFWRVEYNA